MLKQLNKLYFFKFLSFLGISVTFSLLLPACRKEEPKKPQLQCQLPDAPADVIRRFYFPVGSYFIYHEVNTGDIDTLRVVNAYIGYNALSGNYFKVTYQSSFSGNIWIYDYGSTFSCLDCFFGCQLHAVDRAFYDPTGNDLRDSKGFMYPCKVGTQGFTVGGNYYVEEILPELRLYGNNFTDVHIWYHENCPSEDAREDTRFYWGEPAGLLRKTNIVTNKDWVLTEYFLN